MSDITPNLSSEAHRIVNCKPNDLKIALRLADLDQLAQARAYCVERQMTERVEGIASEIKRRLR